MILTVATMSPSSTGAIGGQRRDRDRLVDGVDPVDRVAVDDREPGGLGEQIDAAGEGRCSAHARARETLGEPGRRLVLADVAGLEPRRDDA